MSRVRRADMPKIRYPVKYVTKAQLKYHNIGLCHYPSAGPNPNVTGMRKKYWGWDAALLRHGRYVYKVPPGVYNCF